MSVKRVLVISIVVALLVGLCLSQCAAAAKGKSPIVIGAILTTTGDNAPLGVPERETARWRWALPG